jgi:flagellar basal body rod protein FlgG
MDGLAWMGSAMRAARTQLDVAAHNLANAETNGFAAVVARVGIGPTGLHVETSLRSAPQAPAGLARERGVGDALAPAVNSVDPIAESLAILDAQRAFETAQKAFVAIDEVRTRGVDGVARLA